MILHIVNLTSEATWRVPVGELIRGGPFNVAICYLHNRRPRARLLVSGSDRPVSASGVTANVEVESILDHEIVVLE